MRFFGSLGIFHRFLFVVIVSSSRFFPLCSFLFSLQPAAFIPILLLSPSCKASPLLALSFQSPTCRSHPSLLIVHFHYPFLSLTVHFSFPDTHQSPSPQSSDHSFTTFSCLSISFILLSPSPASQFFPLPSISKVVFSTSCFPIWFQF